MNNRTTTKVCDICGCTGPTTRALEPVQGIMLEQCALCLHNSQHEEYKVSA